ncbi:MAG: pyridoxamine 5'-phosphate oxidase [Algicola sp.]|nr:pyridoxamine 5'-phosphate oxidase [Algicola sp.]
MDRDLGSYRRSYEKHSLTKAETPSDPMVLFNAWFKDVEEQFSEVEANAMTLSTIGASGFPESRIVLLKHIMEGHFVFFTNYKSHKGASILSNPKVCLSFFWPGLERQVIIKGQAKKTSNAVNDEYFYSRPKGSQLGAWVSNQSEVVKNRSVLDAKLEALEAEYANKSIERPSWWGGYKVLPLELEFWQGRPNRLHDRIVYTKNEETGEWGKNRLSP